MQVEKRNGDIVEYDKEKIVTAVVKAMKNLEGGQNEDNDVAKKVARRVSTKIKHSENDIPSVDEVHTLVENALMDMKLHELAREYITYRDKNKPDIFRKRTNIKPYEYPQLLEYVDGIRHSYWIHTEFNYNPDIQDIKVNLEDHERSAVVRSMLAISQIESAVKTFWGKVHNQLPKPEIAKVGATFSESEVRHEDAYSHLIQILGLNDEFKGLNDVPAMRSRIKYLEKVNRNNNAVDPIDYFESIILFSMFIENVSLFSQFFVIMSFNKHNNLLKGMSNAVEATSKEELLHAYFGFDLVNIIKEENPKWWNDDLIDYIKQITQEAYESELKVIEWIYEEGDIQTAPKQVTIEYVKQRLNDSLKAIGIEPMFEIDSDLIVQTEWFDDEIMTTKNVDFFNKRSVAYSKKSQAVTGDDLFD